MNECPRCKTVLPYPYVYCRKCLKEIEKEQAKQNAKIQKILNENYDKFQDVE